MKTSKNSRVSALGDLFEAVGPSTAPALRRQIALVVSYAVLQAVTFLLGVPALEALLKKDVGAAWGWSGAVVACAALTLVVRHLQSMGGFRVGMRTINSLHHRLGDHIVSLPLGWFTAGRTGKLTRQVSQGTKDAGGIVAHHLEPLLTGTLTPLVVVLGMFAWDWRLALALLVCGPLLYAVYGWTSAYAQRVDDRLEESSAEANERVLEFARAQMVLRGSGPEGPGPALLEDALCEQDRASRARARADAPTRMLFGLAVQASLIVALAVGAWRLHDGADPALVAASLVLAVRFAEPAAAVANLGGPLRSARSALDAVLLVLRSEPLPSAAAAPTSIRALDSSAGGVSVELRDVWFSYDADRGPALDGVSVRVPAGRTLALVGASGSGKTTVTRLIARFFDVDEGSVAIAGVDVRDLPADRLAAMLAVVFQDAHLFDDTIGQNIRAGRPEASREEVAAAAATARVDEIVARLPDGWETRVGERGAALSGGERQRVALARALLKDAPVVLLDEATAALDPENQAAVQRSLRQLSGRCTLIVIAHRLETVVDADRIAVLDRGRIVEQGTHAELLASPDGRYAAMWRERLASRGWRLESAVR